MNVPKRVFGLSLLGLTTALFLPGCASTPPVAEQFVGVQYGTNN